MAKKTGAISLVKATGDAKLALGAIMKKYNENSLLKDEPSVFFGNEYVKKVDVISTGSLLFDHVIGCGGIPEGRHIEIFGPEGSGKSTVSYKIGINAQQKYPEKLVLLVDNENFYDMERFKTLGGDPSRIIVAHNYTGEEQLDFIHDAAGSGHCSLIIVDSIEGIVPKPELESDSGESHMGLKARLMNQALRKLMPVISAQNTSIIWINQVREKLNVMYGSPETTPGGRGLKFWSSVRLRVSRIQDDPSDSNLGEGHRIKVKVVKTRYGASLKEAESYLIYNKGFDYLGDLLKVADETGVITKAGPTKTWIDPNTGEEIKWRNRKEFLERVNEVTYIVFENQVKDKLASKNDIEVPLEAALEEDENV